MYVILEVPEVENLLMLLGNEIDPDDPDYFTVKLYKMASGVLSCYLEDYNTLIDNFPPIIIECVCDTMHCIFEELCSQSACGIIVMDRDSVCVDVS